MKRIIALTASLLMVLALCSCGKTETPEDYSAIFASYSVKSENGKFIVEVQDLGGVYDELYDSDGIVIKFYDKEKLTDRAGNTITPGDINYGDTLEIRYSGKLKKNHPKTIKAYEVIKY